MRTYERTKRGHSFSITSKGKELMKTRAYKIPLHIIFYLEYASIEKRLGASEIVRDALVQYFQKNDEKIVEDLGYCDYLRDTYKSQEFIQLYESTM